LNKRTLGKTGEKVSVLGFGCMRFPVIDGNMKNINRDETVKMIRYAIDQGVNYIDTAYVYHEGKSEEVVAEALKDGYREKVFIATKLPVWNVTKTQDMERLLDEQLRNLDTDCIDFYLVHALNRVYWEKLLGLGLIAFMHSAKQKGKVKHWGFSFHDDYDVFEEIVDGFAWSFTQIQYNYLDQTFQAGQKGLRYAADHGLGIVIMEPLRGGTLANGLHPQAKAMIENASIQKTPAEWALRWVWNHPEVGVVLSGMSEMTQVIDNVQYAKDSEKPLNADEKNIIDAIRLTYLDKRRVDCTACKYCMPCPSGVDIPQSFEYYNRAHMMDDVKTARFWYSNIGKASNCTQCGQCETHCPQNIPIMNELKQVVALLES